MPRVLFYSFLLLLMAGGVARSQSPAPSPSPTPKECTAPVYKTSELDKKAKVTQAPHTTLPMRKFDEIEGRRWLEGPCYVGRAK